ncbi:MAG: alpha/beta hydrolase [Hyphomicrobium sp.]
MVGRFSATSYPPAAKGLFRLSESEPQFLDLASGPAAPSRRIAYRLEPAPAGGTGLFWLSGYKSDMASTKATELAAFARAEGFGCARFDYSGHGVSGGDFEDGTIGSWLEEADAVFRLTSGRQVIIGSSMGGYIALLLLKRLLAAAPEEAARIVGLVLIAPAWDMTEELMWKQFDGKARRELEASGVYRQPSEYGEPYAITRALIEEGRHHLMANKPFDPGRPIVILQGRLDTAVPIAHARALLGLLQGNRAELIEIADGEHRLSRPQDLSLLFNKITEVAHGRPPPRE